MLKVKMTYDKFSQLLKLTGLNVREFATVLKLNPNSVTNYASKKRVPKHLAVIAVLMADMRIADRNVDFRSKLSKISIKPYKPRGVGKNAFVKEK